MSLVPQENCSGERPFHPYEGASLESDGIVTKENRTGTCKAASSTGPKGVCRIKQGLHESGAESVFPNADPHHGTIAPKLHQRLREAMESATTVVLEACISTAGLERLGYRFTLGR